MYTLFCSGQEIPNIAYNAPAWGSTGPSFPLITDGDDSRDVLFLEFGKWNFVAVDLGSIKALGLIRLKLRAVQQREDEFTICLPLYITVLYKITKVSLNTSFSYSIQKSIQFKIVYCFIQYKYEYNMAW